MQKDFLPGGSLAVSEGDQILPVINNLQKFFTRILASKDWHPRDHMSFAPQHNKSPYEIIEVHGRSQQLWPIHCVQGTAGAEFASALETARIEKVFYKGTDKEIDSYSAFFDNAHQRSTGLLEYLQQEKIKGIVIVGLATNYCVKFSAIDALNNGIQTIVITDACKGIELQKGDVEQAYQRMASLGAQVMTSEEFLNSLGKNY